MNRSLPAWWAYLASILLVAGLTGCHVVAGFDDLEPTGGGGPGGSTASGGGVGGSTGGAGGTTSGGGGGSEPVYTVGGTLDGLEGELTLDNGYEELVLSEDGEFAFPTPLQDGALYNVIVTNLPTYQSCSMVNNTGQIDGEDVTDILIECDSNVPDLADLTVTCGTLDPSFNPGVATYDVRAGVLASTVQVTPTPLNPASEVRVDGQLVASGTPSAPIALGTGSTTVLVEVTAPSTATRTYSLNVSHLPALATMPTYVKASNPDGNDNFGRGVAMGPNTLVVGAPGESSSATGVDGTEGDDSATDSGAAYVFVQDGCTWSQQAYLKASNTGPNDSFGSALAMSGDTIVVGAPTEDSDATGVNGSQNNNTFLNAGAAYVFVRNGTTWTQQAYLKASNTGAGDRFGTSVAIWGDTIVVGAVHEDSSATGVGGNEGSNGASNAGAAYVFVRTGTTWSQQAYLKASNPEADDRFGRAVAVSGDTVVVGAHNEDSDADGLNGNQSDNSATDAGAVYIFQRQGTAWSHQVYLKAIHSDAGDHFGEAIAAFQDTIVIGAPLEDSAAVGVGGSQTDNGAVDAGAAYVLVRNGSTWTLQAYVKASNTNGGDQFGTSVALFEDSLVIGAPQEDSNESGTGGSGINNSDQASGAAYFFSRDTNSWTQDEYLKASNTEADDNFGGAVAVGDGAVFVSAEMEDSNSPGIGGDDGNNIAGLSGAAYVFQ
ncbi:MAG: cadherin-like beta sandwich domain-containing protein [Deltaproteobacteria bacterium]|nr:cadherin-like beta sandwich domain-containing protein [Deltaproteobacteria bacterium]